MPGSSSPPFDDARRDVKYYTTGAPLSVVNRARRSWSRVNPPTIFPQPQNVASIPLFFAYQLHLTSVSRLRLSAKISSMLEVCIGTERVRAHVLLSSKLPVTQHFCLKFPAAGCDRFLLLLLGDASLSFSLYLSLVVTLEEHSTPYLTLIIFVRNSARTVW